MTTLIDKLPPRPEQRHPEKAHRPDTIRPEKPDWLRVRAPVSAGYLKTLEIVNGHGLNTVCQEAACPNIGSCWEKRHATMMILGAICTRACAFCHVATGKPGAVDVDEPRRVADAVTKLGLAHVVITSVDRDDLDDGGAAHFAAVIRAIRASEAATSIEVLTPDFRKKDGALAVVISARPDVFNHNLETVPALYRAIRPGADYRHSLNLLSRAKRLDRSVVTKSGVMVGLGETRAEIEAVMDDLRAADVEMLTIGQYLQPTLKHAGVKRFVPPAEFDEMRQSALAKGFSFVAASPLTRSSHHADVAFAAIRAQRPSGADGTIEDQPR